MIKILLLLIGICIVAFILWKNLTVPNSTGVIKGQLHPCPATPNCVNTGAEDPEHTLEPLPYFSKNALTIIEEFFQKKYDSKTIAKTPDYLHIVVTTPGLHFKDDVEFLIDKETSFITIRSASRLGYSDLGKNRERIEHLREYIQNR